MGCVWASSTTLHVFCTSAPRLGINFTFTSPWANLGELTKLKRPKDPHPPSPKVAKQRHPDSKPSTHSCLVAITVWGVFTDFDQSAEPQA